VISGYQSIRVLECYPPTTPKYFLAVVASVVQGGIENVDFSRDSPEVVGDVQLA